LTVEAMQRERAARALLQRLGELEKRVANDKSVADELERHRALVKELESFRRYKDMYENLSKRYTEAVEEVSRLRRALQEANRKVDELSKQVDALSTELSKKRRRKKQC